MVNSIEFLSTTTTETATATATATNQPTNQEIINKER
jgi:hypothetical protein